MPERNSYIMKKIIIFLLLLCFSTSAYASGSVYIPLDVAESGHKADISLMLNLGMMENSESGLFDSYAKLSRGEFCYYAARLFGERSFPGESSFTDIQGSYFAKESIDMLTGAGCISDGDFFRPDELIKYEEAVKIVIEILGYGPMASSEGYPDGYMNTAAKAGLLKNVDAEGGYVSKGDCAALLANALDTPVMIYTGVEYKTEKNSTLMREFLKLEKAEGVITSSGYSSISDIDLHSDDAFSVGNLILQKGDTEPEQYLGRYAECFYKENGGEYTAVYIRSEKNTEITVSGNDFSDFDEKRISYYSSSGRKTLILDDGFVVLKNGGALENLSESDFGGENTESIFIDNDRDGKYEVILMQSYKNVFISGSSDDFIYSVISADDNISLEKREKVIFEDADGNQIDRQSISQKGIASVYESDDKELLKVKVSFEKLDGTVSSVSEDDDEINLTIGSAVYKASKNIISRSASISAGVQGTFYIDADRKIAAFEKLTLSGFGYIMRVNENKDDETAQIKMLTKESGIKRYKLSEHITVDGKKYSSSVSASKALFNPSGEKYGVVRYKLSESGEVTMLDTEADNTKNNDDVLRLNFTAERARFKSATSVFEGQFALDDNAVLFRVPTDEENASDDDFSANDKSYFKNDTRYYNLYTYTTDSHIIPQQVILMKDDSKTLDSYALIGIVKDICLASNDDKEVVYKISVNSEGADKEYITKDKNILDDITFMGNKTSVEAGDIIRYKLDGAGRIASCELIFDLDGSEKHIDTNPNPVDFHAAGYRYVFAEVLLKDGNFLEILPEGSEKKETHNLKGVKIFSFDASKKKQDKFSASDRSEIYDRDSSGDGCSKVFIVTKGGVQKALYLYKGV